MFNCLVPQSQPHVTFGFLAEPLDLEVNSTGRMAKIDTKD